MFGLHHQRTAGVHRGTDQFVALALGHRQRLTREHRFVNSTAALDYDAIDWHFLSGAHAQLIAFVYVRQRHVLFRTVRIDTACGLGRQTEQRLDRGRGLRACLQFQDLAKQSQRDDRSGGLEIHRHAPIHDKGSREDLRRHGGDDAVDESHPSAQADQRPHVGAAVDHRLRAAFVKRQAGPQRHWQGQPQLNPVLAYACEQAIKPSGPMPHHGQRDDHHSEGQGPPEAAGEIIQLRVFVVAQCRHHRLKRHAAYGAVAGMVLADLGVHRAGVNRARLRSLRWRQCRRLLRLRVFLGRCLKLRLALGAAEVEGVAVVLKVVLRCRRHGHAAHRVFQRTVSVRLGPALLLTVVCLVLVALS